MNLTIDDKCEKFEETNKIQDSANKDQIRSEPIVYCGQKTCLYYRNFISCEVGVCLYKN